VGFLNRVPPPLAVNNARTIGLGSLVPLDVVAYGGASRVVALVTPTGGAFLGAPSAGYVWILRRVIASWTGATAGELILYGTSGAYYSLLTTSGIDNCEGLICPEALSAIASGSSVDITTTLFYDQVLIPAMQ
jgi:hypothetical protein